MKEKFILFLTTGLLILISLFLLTSPPKKDSLRLNADSPKTKSLFRKIFDEEPLPANPVVIIATGDVMLGRTINSYSVRQNNFTWMWEKTADTLRSADLTIVNLESPLAENCPVTDAGMVFCGDVRQTEGLVFAGIDIANLANNHIRNYGPAGIKTTTELLNRSGLIPIGIGTTEFKTVRGVKFAFLGYNGLEKLPDIEKEIAEAKRQSNFLIVSFHWGAEYTTQPNARQQVLAHLAVDSGADLVIGHHPHWIQPTEVYKNGLIVYSLGNFIFDQSWSLKTRQGQIGKFTFWENKPIDYELIPIEISLLGQPSLK